MIGMRRKYLGVFFVLFFGFIVVYFIVSRSDYREGVIVLSHYLFGNGSDLILESDYMPQSPVIRKRLKTMKIGEKQRVSFKQQQDWRLSYAINGFELTKTSSGFSIHQYIAFDTTGTVYTDVKSIFGKVRVYDNWVHIIGGNSFHLYYLYGK
jgi:hypothetical protein